VSALAPSSARAAQSGSGRAIDQAAIDAYRRGDLDSARSGWIELVEPRASAAEAGGASDDPRAPKLSSAERARILYDLGNVAYRKKAILEAVGWYTAALRLSPRDPDIWWNLEHARSEAKLEPADRGDLSATLQRLVSSLTLAESEWLVLGVLTAWAGTLAFEAFRGGRASRRVALAGAFVVLASLAPWLYNLERAGRHPMLSIQDGRTALKSEPRADAPAIAEVGAGEEVERRDSLPEWTKIELASGVQGWVPRSAVFALDR